MNNSVNSGVNVFYYVNRLLEGGHRQKEGNNADDDERAKTLPDE